MVYGEIIKKIRKQKGFTQKEVYGNVVSKTFYSDFEKGKYTISIEKFEGLLSNLGITYREFDYIRQEKQQSEISHLTAEIDRLYNQGQFEALYDLYETNHQHSYKEVRYLAIKAYLLVLITNTNFYKFSRQPFNEITAELEKAKRWTLLEIRLGKLVLLSVPEKSKDYSNKLFQRLLKELDVYQQYDKSLFFEEVGDLYFNRIQSLLVTHDIGLAKATLGDYGTIMAKSDHVHWLIQLKFMTILVHLYFDYPSYDGQLQQFLKEAKKIPTSETRFYEIIAQLHQEKALTYYTRYALS